MIGPKTANMVSLSDLRSCPMTPIFFDTFFNLEKYLDHEQRDPFASQRDMDEDGNEVIYHLLSQILCQNVNRTTCHETLDIKRDLFNICF